MTAEVTTGIELAPSRLGQTLSAVRLCAPEVKQEMQLSLSRLDPLTPAQAYRVGDSLELFDGLKQVRAGRALSWPKLRVEVHVHDAAGAKVRPLRCKDLGGHRRPIALRFRSHERVRPSARVAVVISLSTLESELLLEPPPPWRRVRIRKDGPSECFRANHPLVLRACVPRRLFISSSLEN